MSRHRPSADLRPTTGSAKCWASPRKPEPPPTPPLHVPWWEDYLGLVCLFLVVAALVIWYKAHHPYELDPPAARPDSLTLEPGDRFMLEPGSLSEVTTFPIAFSSAPLASPTLYSTIRCLPNGHVEFSGFSILFVEGGESQGTIDVVAVVDAIDGMLRCRDMTR